jgi:transposase-like protein
MRNVLDKVPDVVRAEVKAHLVAIRDTPTYEAGRQTALAVLARFKRAYPTAMASLPAARHGTAVLVTIADAQRRAPLMAKEGPYGP